MQDWLIEVIGRRRKLTIESQERLRLHRGSGEYCETRWTRRFIRGSAEDAKFEYKREFIIDPAVDAEPGQLGKA
jgi:hypothetical protein